MNMKKNLAIFYLDMKFFMQPDILPQYNIFRSFLELQNALFQRVL